MTEAYNGDSKLSEGSGDLHIQNTDTSFNKNQHKETAKSFRADAKGMKSYGSEGGWKEYVKTQSEGEQEANS